MKTWTEICRACTWTPLTHFLHLLHNCVGKICDWFWAWWNDAEAVHCVRVSRACLQEHSSIFATTWSLQIWETLTLTCRQWKKEYLSVRKFASFSRFLSFPVFYIRTFLFLPYRLKGIEGMKHDTTSISL